MTREDLLFEQYPTDLADSLQRVRASRRRLAAAHPSLEFIVSDLARWPPGSTVTVGFLDGTPQLHRSIAEAVQPITDACNLKLDFGFKSTDQTYRQWSTNDGKYSADIRVSFDLSGYWSLVGTASIDPSIGLPHAASGGRPHQRSLNLGGFDIELPSTWRRTVLHEFLHALSFSHEHQNMRGPCQQEFRWENDPGYVATLVDGRFGADSNGRRPGIYTYLGGPPNNWNRKRVDHNLRVDYDEDSVAGAFDAASVMLYRFPTHFYKTNPSPCAPVGSGEELSDGDVRGLALLYPNDARQVQELAGRAAAGLEAIRCVAHSLGPLETTNESDHMKSTGALLERFVSNSTNGGTVHA